MAELVAEVLDVARERLVDAQLVVGQQRDQRGPVGFGGVERARARRAHHCRLRRRPRDLASPRLIASSSLVQRSVSSLY
jgi:hypothetical protein